MDFFEAQRFFSNAYPDKKIEYSFPLECHRKYEIYMVDGKRQNEHHLECRKLMVKVEGLDPIKVDIMPHRIVLTNEQLEEQLNFSR